MTSEAKARIKIDEMLLKAGWRFFADENGPANILLEDKAQITKHILDAMGEDFEQTHNGYVDYLLLDEAGFPFVVLEAKREQKNPLDGKEQARRYTHAKNARFVILSNGNLHYFWDLYRGNPMVITEFPTQASLKERLNYNPDPRALSDEPVGNDYIAITQDPHFKTDPRWLDEKQRDDYIREKGLRILRHYQLSAVHALQKSTMEGSDRFLFEMATGTGKTLVAAAVIKLFLRTGNAQRVLFLVDRIALEDQAKDNFKRYLQMDYTTMIYKENRSDWRQAQIVVSTVQSLTFDNKFMRLFSPTDFDLIISDEAHRSINGNSRALFEYFVGYKLGLTATPKDYLRQVDGEELARNNPRAWERRQLLDTYKTFGCASGEPTYRYSLLDGVQDGYLINPIVVDARTEITTQLLSEEGYAVMVEGEEEEEEEKIFFKKDFERKLFSTKTNRQICATFMKHALRDPISQEIGKTIMFCVSQDHAARMAQILNEMADEMFPDKYQSDFAMQITSNVDWAQQYTVNFAHNNLRGHSHLLRDYDTSKTRVCVTVGMMTTGYDCQDILNLGLVRPIFSPTDFVQMKGRGTRTFLFHYDYKEDGCRRKVVIEKERFKLFDFFANCEYFEEDYDYDEVLQLPQEGSLVGGGEVPVVQEELSIYNPDPLANITETKIGLEGMRVDRELFQHFTRPITADREVVEAVKNEQWEHAIRLVQERYANKPEDFVTLEKLTRAEQLDRRLTWKEVLQRAFGMIEVFKNKDALLEDEFKKFVAIHKPESGQVLVIKRLMKAYITDPRVREALDSKQYAQLATNPSLSLDDLKIAGDWRDIVPEYIKDYISLKPYL